MCESSESTTLHSIESQLQETNLELAQAQLRKLNLEIENLKPKRKWPETIVSYIPIITALISVSGLISGILIFTSQQEADRRTREEDRISRDKMQYRNSFDQLLQFSSNPDMTAQRVVFLRKEIDQLIDSIYPRESEKNQEENQEKNQEEKDMLKARILDLINLECDYTQTRHVQLDIAGFKNWTDYEKDLKTLMTKYYDALRQLHRQKPEYIESLTYDPKSGFIQALSDPLDISFESLVRGFSVRLEELEGEERQKAIEDFGTYTNNPKLAGELFNDKSNEETGSGKVAPPEPNPE